MGAVSGYDGWLHAGIAKRVALAFTLAAVPVAFDDPLLALGLLCGAWAGFLLTPDIDHKARTTEEHRIDRMFGGCVGVLWSFYWSPYARLFGHRSPWTHGLLGTPIRMAYALWLLVLLQLRFRWDAIPFWAGMLAAWLLQDLLHYLVDKF